MVTLDFTKAEALGNDFIIAEALSKYSADQLQFLADRKKAIGCDQFISIEAKQYEDCDFTIRFYNADGSWAGGCGNGSRAIAGYFAASLQKQHLTFAIERPSGTYDIINAHVTGNHVSLKMPKPRFLAEDIPIHGVNIDPQNLKLDEIGESGFCVNVGNPHIVFIVDNAEDISLDILGPKTEHHSYFPNRINAEWVHIIDREHIRMRVWERGAGITAACGTGACASAIAAITRGLCEEEVCVICDGGEIDIAYQAGSDQLLMAGPYHISFKGQIVL
ncbi:MAG: diaminopimelate epimerase [Pseudomonadota bacterium]